MKKSHKRKNKGFSLVELSMVLVIISLIASSVLVGDSLIESAEIRGQVTQLTSYDTAVYAFISKYSALPGDMRNANSFWPAAANGDGDGRISTFGEIVLAFQLESFTIFQHLSLAGYIEGSYDNMITSSSLGKTYPALKINSDAGMMSGFIQHPGYDSATLNQERVELLTKQYKAVLYLNGCNIPAAGGILPGCGTMTPGQTKGIDDKIDDGKPGYGMFIGYKAFGAASNCLTGVDGDYLSDSSDVSCSAYYVLK